MMFSVSKFFTISALFCFLACSNPEHEKGNKKIITLTHAVSDFNEVIVEGRFEVHLKKGSSPAVDIKTDENLHNFIRVDQSKNVLKIAAERRLKSKSPIQIFIKAPDLVAVRSNGNSKILSEDTLRGDYLRLNQSGGGIIDLKLALKALKVTVSGAGTVRLAGKVFEQNVQLTGAGGLEAYNLISKNCKIRITGVGGATINVQELLEASVSGVGGISYRGDPKVISDVSGMGIIRKAQKNSK